MPTPDLGKVLEFVIAPNLHWPDTIFTTMPKRILTVMHLGCTIATITPLMKS